MAGSFRQVAAIMHAGVRRLHSAPMEARVGERMRREGMLHPGVVMRFGDADHRIDLADLLGKHVTRWCRI